MTKPKEFSQTFFHGTKADLKHGDLITTGFKSNYDDQEIKYVYMTSNINVAAWGAELASGEGKPRIYIVEATGEIHDDPNVTDKKFPGNPTRSYRSVDALKVEGEVIGWQGHSSQEIDARKEALAKLAQSGAQRIE